MTPENVILTGDCVEVMATLDADSVDAVVTDPPYGLEFMGKEWDRLAETPGYNERGRMTPESSGLRARKGFREMPNSYQAGRPMQEWHEAWAREALRVAKPGAHLLAAGGTRTYHRLVCAIEDAGWEVRDTVCWIYFSGFPKSANPGRQHDLAECRKAGTHRADPAHTCPMVAPPEMYGLGTALKPAWEPWVLARKPLRGTVAANVTSLGTGAINIDATRIPFASNEGPDGREGEPTAQTRYDDEPGDFAAKPGRRVRMQRQHVDTAGMRRLGGGGFDADHEQPMFSDKGRWPANVVLTDAVFDGDVPGVVGGGTQSGGGNPRWRSDEAAAKSYGGYAGGTTGLVPADTEGTYSRFFLVPKADRADREPVLGGLTGLPTRGEFVGPGSVDPERPTVVSRRNHHPTVKPTELMRHLVRLVTPPGGLVLDPFLGSGTTALAAEMEGFRWLGIEREAEYVTIAEARLNGTQRGLGLVG